MDSLPSCQKKPRPKFSSYQAQVPIDTQPSSPTNPGQLKAPASGSTIQPS